MAESPERVLTFGDGCPDCGERTIVLPPAIPAIADDFDWAARDYDSFRLMMMEELAYRFPERRRWTPADMEVVIVELLASGLDRASHALDVIHGERYLETARRPQSVRRLLNLIGYDAAAHIPPDVLEKIGDDPADVDLPPDARDARRVERYWKEKPSAMEEARRLGPSLVREQRRMVSLDDHETLLVAHPLVERARSRLSWSGAWSTILVSVLLLDGLRLDRPVEVYDREADDTIDRKTFDEVVKFHRDWQLPAPLPGMSVRAMLQGLIDTYRMVGTEVLLEDAKEAPIVFTLSVRARPQYFQSEMKVALSEVLSASNGLFSTRKVDFGRGVYASDIIEAAYLVEGVESACLNRFKRQGARYPDRTKEGFIPIADDEIAVCLNRRSQPGRGSFRIVVNGGAIG